MCCYRSHLIQQGHKGHGPNWSLNSGSLKYLRKKAISNGKSIFNWIYASALLLRPQDHFGAQSRFTDVSVTQISSDHSHLWKRSFIDILPFFCGLCSLRGKNRSWKENKNRHPHPTSPCVLLTCLEGQKHSKVHVLHLIRWGPPWTSGLTKATSHDTHWRRYKGRQGRNSATLSESIKPSSYQAITSVIRKCVFGNIAPSTVSGLNELLIDLLLHKVLTLLPVGLVKND